MNILSKSIMFSLRKMKVPLRAVSNKAESFVTAGYWLINYIDTKAKCRHLKKWPVEGLCGRCYLSAVPSPPRIFVWGGLAIFRFWIWSYKECSTPAEFGLQQDSTPPTPSQPKHCLYSVLWHGEGGGRGECWIREKVRGATIQGRVGEIPTWLTVSSVYKL